MSGGAVAERARAVGVGHAVLAAGVGLHLCDIGAPLLSRREPHLVDAGGDVAGGVPDRGRIFPGVASLPAGGGGRVRRARGAGVLVLARVVPAEADAPHMGSLGQRAHSPGHMGVAVFALAAVLALLYLFEDRQLKRKQFERMMGRGTPLETLDRLALRCVSVGFPVFTVAIVTGRDLGGPPRAHAARRAALRPSTSSRVATWAAFGVLLIARVGAGWRGRRAAWLTLGGFGGAMLVLLTYFLRHAA